MDFLVLAETAAPSLDVLLSYGPLGVFTAVVLYFVIRWGDKAATGHMELVRVSTEAQARNAVSLEGISEAIRSLNALANTHESQAEKAVRIASHVARGHVAEAANPEAKRHFERAVEESGNN